MNQWGFCCGKFLNRWNGAWKMWSGEMFVNKTASSLSYHISGQSKILISYRQGKLWGDTFTVIGPPWPHSRRRAQRWWWGGGGWGRRWRWSTTTRPRPPSWSRFSENNKRWRQDMIMWRRPTWSQLPYLWLGSLHLKSRQLWPKKFQICSDNKRLGPIRLLACPCHRANKEVECQIYRGSECPPVLCRCI